MTYYNDLSQGYSLAFFLCEITFTWWHVIKSFILIAMLRVYGHYKYFNPFSPGTVFIRQNLTYKDRPRADGVKSYILTEVAINYYIIIPYSRSLFKIYSHRILTI